MRRPRRCGSRLIPGAAEAQASSSAHVTATTGITAAIGGRSPIAAGFAGGTGVGGSVAGDDANTLEQKQWSVGSP